MPPVATGLGEYIYLTTSADFLHYSGRSESFAVVVSRLRRKFPQTPFRSSFRNVDDMNVEPAPLQRSQGSV